MHTIFPIGTPPARSDRRWAPGIIAFLMVALASFVAVPRPAAAQMEYDFNGDDKVTCADFEEQYPNTFTDEATKALQTYPDDLSSLDKGGQKGIACEEPGSTAADSKPASKTPKAPKTPKTPEPVAQAPADPTPAPPIPEPASPAGIAGPGSLERVDVPADVMARVEGCAVIAISRRGVVGAGCPGIGSVAFRIPDDAPSMKGTVIITPMASRAVETGAPRESTAATGSSGSTRDDTASAKSAKAEKSTSKDKGKGKSNAKGKKKQSAESTRKGGGKEKQNGTSSTKKQKKAKKNTTRQSKR